MHGLSPFSNKFAIKFLQVFFVHEVQITLMLKIGVLNFLGYLHIDSFLCFITVNG